MKGLNIIFRERIGHSVLIRSLNVLPSGDKKKMIAISILQTFLSLMDLMGVLIVGVIAPIVIQTTGTTTPTTRLAFLDKYGWGALDPKNQALYLGLLAVGLLVGRTLASIFLTRRVLFFLSNRGSKVSSSLVSLLLNQSMLRIQQTTSQEIIFNVTAGVEAITLKILATAVSMVADFSLLLIMIIGLIFIDPAVAISTVGLFSMLAIVLYKLMSVRASNLGFMSSLLEIQSGEKIYEAFNSYRETVVKDRRHFYATQIGNLRVKLANVAAEVNFLPYASKYVIELLVIVGAILLAGIQFMLFDLGHAAETLSVFLVAGTRIAPAVLRLQQGALLIKGNTGRAIPALNLIDEFKLEAPPSDSLEVSNFEYAGFQARFELNNISFTYPGSNTPAIKHANIQVTEGQSIAIVGGSGAGKTTLIDMLLGLIAPDEGSVQLSGMQPSEAFVKWPGAVAYVPQDVVISNGTIRENICLGFPVSLATDELIYSALRAAQLEKFVRSMPDGLETSTGERGVKLSGGQRQRIGIARAMFTRPKLLVLDEATSSLDSETEAALSEAIQSFRGSITVVMIAHRLSTVRNADLVIYLENGVIKATGKFEEVRVLVPNFDNQAKLMGL